MPITTLTLKVYSNSSLTTLFGSVKSLSHNSDLSDNPKEFQAWIGSRGSDGLGATDRIFYDKNAPGTGNILITPVDILPAWTANTAVSLGQSVEPTVDNGYRYEASVAGTTGATEPTWPTGAIGSTIASGTAVFKLVGASHQTSEIKLATTQAGLNSAVAGASLNLGTSIRSGVANAKTFWVRVTNAVTTASNNSGTPEIGFDISDLREERYV